MKREVGVREKWSLAAEGNEVTRNPPRAFFTAPRDSRHSLPCFQPEATMGDDWSKAATTPEASFTARSVSQNRERGQAKMGGRNSGGSCRDGDWERYSTVSAGPLLAKAMTGRTSRKNSILF